MCIRAYCTNVSSSWNVVNNQIKFEKKLLFTVNIFWIDLVLWYLKRSYAG